MEAASIVDQGCLFAGHRLLQCHANDQDHTFNLHERSVMDKQSLKEWAQLKKKSIQRSMNSIASQRSNFLAKQGPANLPVTPDRNKTKHRATSAVAARTRLQRRDRDLPLHTVRPKVKRPKHLQCHKFGCTVNNYTQNENGSFKYKHIKYNNVPKYPTELKGKMPRKQSVVHHQVKIFHRREMLP
jgi:hypothetical protein